MTFRLLSVHKMDHVRHVSANLSVYEICYQLMMMAMMVMVAVVAVVAC
jgi:hypothetical protein